MNSVKDLGLRELTSYCLELLTSQVVLNVSGDEGLRVAAFIKSSTVVMVQVRLRHLKNAVAYYKTQAYRTQDVLEQLRNEYAELITDVDRDKINANRSRLDPSPDSEVLEARSSGESDTDISEILTAVDSMLSQVKLNIPDYEASSVMKFVDMAEVRIRYRQYLANHYKTQAYRTHGILEQLQNDCAELKSDADFRDSLNATRSRLYFSPDSEVFETSDSGEWESDIDISEILGDLESSLSRFTSTGETK